MKINLKQIEKVIVHGNGKSKKPSSNLKDFIKLFYRDVPVEIFTDSTTAQLFAAAEEVHKFVSEKKQNAPRKVRVYNPTIEKNGWKSERTLVETCAPDSPFILDSLTAEITKKGYRIYEIIHPVVRLNRDKQGKVQKFHNDNADTNGALQESIMQFQISHLSDKTLINDLEKSLKNVLYHVHLAVADWRPLLAKAEEATNSLNNLPKTLNLNKDYIDEVRGFMRWVVNNNFIFVGYRECKISNKTGKANPITVKGSELGIFKENSAFIPPPRTKTPPSKKLSLLDITKSDRKSLIHRPVHMDHISIKKFDKNGNVVGEHRFIGLFTSAVYFQSALLIPIIRKKIEEVVRRSGFKSGSHNGKALITILENYPRDELLQITEDDLFRISMGIVELSERPATKLFVRRDRYNRFVSCIVFIPRDRFNTTLRIKVQNILAEEFEGEVTDHYIQVAESPLARVLVIIKLDPDNKANPNLDAIEERLTEITSSWTNGLRDALIQRIGEREGESIYYNYVNAFPETFKDTYHFGGTLCDILKMEQAYENNTLTLELYQTASDGKDFWQLKLYNPEVQLTLSNILPLLENMGFHGVEEHTYLVSPKHKNNSNMWIHHFRMKIKKSVGDDDTKVLLKEIKQNFEEALHRIWRKEIENDIFNALIVRTTLPWRDVMIIRAYSRYILQTEISYSGTFIAKTVSRYPEITKLFVDLFYAKFDPKKSAKARKDDIKSITEETHKQLYRVTNIAEDRVLQQFFDTITATTRTNYFQKTEKGGNKSYISFKFDSKKVPNLPQPIPYAEIFVYSYNVEGVHLRGGKVARGGLRWSDRAEDYRTEVLGLVKAQMVKNSVIVPVGSKGGFVVKHPINGDNTTALEQGIECYKTYLCGLLDITDNFVKGKVIPPKDVVCHDGDDPYLVVAADKGTATFSDIANSVAQDYNFWLDDAFASGGSAGYDHKVMGITAKGAWISVKRHFMEMGIDCQNEDITTIGIGDMSGDVFGNGMLLSKHIKLVGAFNHMHIFIDPNPDISVSFRERSRLFRKPRSGWQNYNKELLSEGGRIFERSVKSIKLTKQIKQMLDIEEATITPDDLIKKLLTADVDLLWNGGIGTYVKADDETHDAVGDKTNDTLRVNAKELRCKVIGEGGNLGLTQRGRISYAMKGGRLNTDAIDNSAGVDCSDHEVNIKIALGKAMSKGKITRKQRDKLLFEMTEEVSNLVLRDNVMQTQLITIAELQGHMRIERESRLIRALEEKGLLDRMVEYIPDDEALASRQAAGKGLTRPEFAVVLSYSKLDAYDELKKTNLPEDTYYNKDLLNYFPELMREKFKAEIISHELRRDIIATLVCNSMVNRAGSTFFNRMKENTGMKGCDVARGYTITRDSFGLREIWDNIENLGSDVSAEIQTELYLETRALIDRTTSWFLRTLKHPLDVAKTVKVFEPGIKEVEGYIDDLMPPITKEVRDKKYNYYIENNVPKNVAKKIANLEALSAACEIVHVASITKKSLHVVGEIYFGLGTRLQLVWLRVVAKDLISHSHWKNLAVQTLNETLADHQMSLVKNVITRKGTDKNCDGALDLWYAKKEKLLSRYDKFIEELKRQDAVDHSMITVATQRIKSLI